MNFHFITETLKSVLVSKAVPADEIAGYSARMWPEAMKVVRASIAQSMEGCQQADLYKFQVKAASELLAWAKAQDITSYAQAVTPAVAAPKRSSKKPA